VVHREIPDVPRSAQRSIHGHIKIAVRVSVDRSGRVVDETMEQAGSSRYFARLASESAKKWKFIPADQDARSYLLRFEFSRNTVEARAAQEP
jgi:TonB family protein